MAAALVFEIAPNTRYYQQAKAKHSLNFPQLMCHDAASVLELTMGHCIQWLLKMATIVTNIITDQYK